MSERGEVTSDTPRVSVIVPTRNRPQLLREALQSLVKQRGVRFEVIVVNDAGEDVQSVIDEFTGALDITYIQLARNQGLPAARNRGVERARGSYIAYLDDDDLLLPSHLARLAARLDARSDVGLVYADALLLRQKFAEEGLHTVAHRILAHDFDIEIMRHDSFIAPSAMMHRRECFDAVGGFDEAMRWCYEDWDFLLRVANRYRIERVAGATAVIRLRNDNMSRVVRPERARAARLLQQRYGAGEIEPKTFWEVADTLEAMKSNR
ncbi:glycosyltransferase family 2 protein [Pyrinomonas methylaliphatogenes]|uniref:Glycosyl transferase n=1 Tax=Pyrinomonas methylaliphatogenes TaxID=454194 RepID=A0A0B6WVR5_9BACT|nr:glycosyltransferase family A protein [Pyrinomonas methylaliphatogenes]CDM64374.1 glycosyl transferase [Pyrinomonas methylaliphatogenes]